MLFWKEHLNSLELVDSYRFASTVVSEPIISRNTYFVVCETLKLLLFGTKIYRPWKNTKEKMRQILGGIEGGGTRSNVTLIDADTSEVLATVQIELATNLWVSTKSFKASIAIGCHNLYQIMKWVS